MKTRIRPPASVAKQWLVYDPITGWVRWRKSNGNRSIAWKRAGTLNKISGYRSLQVCGFLDYEHRWIWAYMTGEWPPDGLQIDHANRQRQDNRWGNLRLGTPTENKHNTGLRATNTTGHKGVSWCAREGLFRARITLDGKEVGLGYYKTAEEAGAAYEKAAVSRNQKFHPRYCELVG